MSDTSTNFFITFFLYKNFELLRKQQIPNYNTYNSQINSNQADFRKGKPTTVTILAYRNFVSECDENEEHCIAIFLDLTKAFDCSIIHY